MMHTEILNLSSADLLDIYRGQIERWEALTPEQYVAPMAVRLLALRWQRTMGYNYDAFVRRASCDITDAARCARAELEARQAFLMMMITKHQDSATDVEEMTRALGEELAAADSEEGQRRLRAFLDRVVRRYWRFEQHTKRVLSS